jgi:hypothetical protein
VTLSLPPPTIEDIDNIDLFRLASLPLDPSDLAVLYRIPISEIEDRLLNKNTFEIDDKVKIAGSISSRVEV